MWPPDDVENGEDGLCPGVAVLGHARASDADQRLDAIAQAGLGFRDGHWVRQLAIK